MKTRLQKYAVDGRVLPSSEGDFMYYNDVVDIISEMNKYWHYIGQKVCKCTTTKTPIKSVNIKPFKSGLFSNTVKEIGIHPILGIPVFYFLEDESYVQCNRCYLVPKSDIVLSSTFLQKKYGINYKKIVGLE